MTPADAMPRAWTVVIGSACTACGACLLTCPEHALRPAPRRPDVTAACTGCAECLEICPADAIELVPKRTPIRSPTERAPNAGRVHHVRLAAQELP